MAHSLPGFAQDLQSGPSSPPLVNPVNEPSRLSLVPGQSAQQTEQAAANQQLANAIASQLRMSGNLKGYTIDIRVTQGTVELTGQVASQVQREEAVRIVQGVPGVERVRDSLQLQGQTVTPVTATVQQSPAEPRPLLSSPADGLTGPLPGNQAPEPMSIFHAPPSAMGGPAAGSIPPPPLPPYAWPTYAPYNNFSRVAYPSLYPYQAFPFIGPMYPFPKVPLGWRSVQLRWMDGHWWYGRNATGHDWWRVRYW
jgi:hypothetical protein